MNILWFHRKAQNHSLSTIFILSKAIFPSSRYQIDSSFWFISDKYWPNSHNQRSIWFGILNYWKLFHRFNNKNRISKSFILICHLATHRCGWLSFGLICRSIKSLDKGFHFFGSVIFSLVSILDVTILSSLFNKTFVFLLLFLSYHSRFLFSISLYNLQILNHLLSLCDYFLF